MRTVGLRAGLSRGTASEGFASLRRSTTRGTKGKAEGQGGHGAKNGAKNSGIRTKCALLFVLIFQSHATDGESWDVVEVGETVYEKEPNFNWNDAYTLSPNLINLANLPKS